jgi:aldose 1-epimerase
LQRSDFAGTYLDKKIDLYSLRNTNGLKTSITNYGARLVELQTPDRDGNFDNIIVGYSSMPDFLNKEEGFFGAILGRYANRIGKAKFELNGKEFVLDKNWGADHIHGGSMGFYKVVWGANQVDDQTLHLSYRAEEGEGGYPGNLGISVTYHLTDENELRVKFRAEADDDTIINVSHHPYFNLHGIQDGSSVDAHLLYINADKYTPVNEDLIPTGEIVPVFGTPFDFSNTKPVGKDRKADHPQLKYGGGYDHNFVLSKEQDGSMSHAARIQDPKTGRQLDLYTTEPGLQLFVTDEPIEGVQSSICLEAQHFPDSPNHPNFPSTLLKAYETYESEIVYGFSTFK